MNYKNLAPKILRLKLLIFDVDGVLTDGGITYLSDGAEMRRFDVKDGYSLCILHSIGIKTAILSGKVSDVVARRAKELRFDYIIQGNPKKLQAYEKLLSETGLKADETGFMGDEIIDLPVMRRSGFSASPADAHPAVKAAADYVCKKAGGMGAVREVIDLIYAFRTGNFGAVEYLPQEVK